MVFSRNFPWLKEGVTIEIRTGLGVEGSGREAVGSGLRARGSGRDEARSGMTGEGSGVRARDILSIILLSDLITRFSLLLCQF